MESLSELSFSRWFARGWTLQELVAPATINFYNSNWKCSGSKKYLIDYLVAITGIERFILFTGSFDHISIATKISWAAKRESTRIEDQSYCLLGIFDVNMPLLYGEGKKAFKRL